MAISKRTQKRLKKSSMAHNIRKFSAQQNKVTITTCKKCTRKITLQELINHCLKDEESMVIDHEGFCHGDLGSADMFTLENNGNR